MSNGGAEIARGMIFYRADLFSAWKGSLFIGGLGSKALVRLTLDRDRLIGEERLLTKLRERIRDDTRGRFNLKELPA